MGRQVGQYGPDAPVLDLLEEHGVELGDQRDQLGAPVIVAQAHALAGDAAEIGQLMVAHGLGRRPRGRHLDDLAELVDLLQVAGGVLGDDRTPERVQLHQAVLLEAGQGLPDRGLADAQALGDVGLAERLARRDPQLHDRGLELVVDRVGHRAALGELAEHGRDVGVAAAAGGRAGHVVRGAEAPLPSLW